jgi:signal transduction histidine kinase
VFQPRTWNARRRLEAFAQRSREMAQRPAALQEVLAASLGDPSAELGLWMREQLVYVGVDGRPLGALEAGRSCLRLDLHREPVAVVRHDAALDRDRRLLDTVATEAALLAENARLQAEVLAQLSEVQASRSRIVAAADAERRRVERNLHDGAQQRLVGLAVRVKLASRTSDDPLLPQVVAELQAATRELRELAQGIHPAALEHGLGAALESLAARTPVPLAVAVAAGRLPGEVERTAYYLACEAITNAVKHADASRLEVSAQVVGERLVLTVHDDGRGGADASRGSGIAGLYDRAAAMGGSVRVESPSGGGTTMVADVPCGC